MQRRHLRDIIPFSSPISALVAEVRRRKASVSEYGVELVQPRSGLERNVDVFATPLGDEEDAVVMMLQERTIADKMNRQLTHRGAARSMIALGAMLAHEIKNPLAGIRGAAQLLEQSGTEDDRLLTRLICDESDRIVRIVERMELFGDERPVERGPVNVHGVLDQVKRSAQSGFARHIRFVETYDPSAAAGPRQSRSVDPGHPQPREERRRGHRRRCGGRRDHPLHRLPYGAEDAGSGLARAGQPAH